MASKALSHDERMRNVVKYQNAMRHVNTFLWNIYNYDDMRISSNLFYFCGYYCYLYLEYSVGEDMTDKLWFLDIIIGLRGYPAPFQNNLSCQYSLFTTYIDGELPKTGEIQTQGPVIDIELYAGVWADDINSDLPHYSTICFSWSENGDCEVYSQGVQTESEKSIPVLERGSQTEGACISPTSELIDNSEKESYKFLQILSNDFGSLHESTMDPDCVLKVGEVKFPVHRTVLSARSTVFAAMFHHDTSESQSGEVDILDIDGDVFGDVLYYIYTGKIRGLSSGTAASMYIASDKYALIQFRDKCLNYLMHNLNVDNVGDAALLAHTHAEIQLENEIIHFIEENLEELMLNETWIRFSDTHLKLANKLLCSASIAIKKKFQKSHLS